MKFSLLLPTFNRSQQLAEILPFLERIQYPAQDFEIIIVDNNSSDQTKKVVQDFISRTKLQVRYAFAKQQGRTFASITGFELAKHDKIIFIDDDIAVRPDLLKVYRKYYLKYPEVAVIGGEIIASFSENNPNKHFLVRYVLKCCPWVFGQLSYGKKSKYITYPNAVFAGNMSLCLSAFDSTKEIFSPLLGRPFDGNYFYAEDYELCLRLHLQKQKILYVPELRVENRVETDRLQWKYVWKRHLNGGTERYIIDQLLNHFPNHQPFSHGFKDLLKSSANRQNTEQKVDWIFDCVYWWGYVKRGPNIYQKMLKSLNYSQ